MIETFYIRSRRTPVRASEIAEFFGLVAFVYFTLVLGGVVIASGDQDLLLINSVSQISWWLLSGSRQADAFEMSLLNSPLFVGLPLFMCLSETYYRLRHQFALLSNSVVGASGCRSLGGV